MSIYPGQLGCLQKQAFPSLSVVRHSAEQNSFPAGAEHLHRGCAHFFSVLISPSGMQYERVRTVHTGFFPSAMCRRWTGTHPPNFRFSAKKTYRTITTEMLRRNNVGSIDARDPDSFRRRLAKSRKYIGESTNDSTPQSECRFKREVEDRGSCGGKLYVRRCLAPSRRNQHRAVGDDYDKNHERESHGQLLHSHPEPPLIIPLQRRRKALVCHIGFNQVARHHFVQLGSFIDMDSLDHAIVVHDVVIFTLFSH